MKANFWTVLVSGAGLGKDRRLKSTSVPAREILLCTNRVRRRSCQSWPRRNELVAKHLVANTMAGKKDSTSKPGPARQNNRPPPSYNTLYPPSPAASNGPTADITKLRDASPRLALDPPLPQRTPFKTAEAAARTALCGTALAFDQSERGVLAAHTAHAIALAVSTSRSYTAFVAATTAAESAALIAAEGYRHNHSEDHKCQRARDAVRRAAETAVAVNAGNTPYRGWPPNTRDGA